MDLAPLEVHRHPAGRVEVGAVALVVVVREPLVDVRLPGPVGGALTGLGQRQPGGQVGVGDVDGVVERQPGRTGRCVHRVAPAVLLPALRERRVDLVGVARPVPHPVRGHGVRRAGPHQLDAGVGERLLDFEVAAVAVGAVVGRDVHPARADLLRGEHDLAHRIAAYDGQARVPLPERGVEGAQGLPEVPPARDAGRSPQRRVEHEQRQHAVTVAGIQEGRVVAEAEVPAEPHHGCRGHAAHSARRRKRRVRTDETEWPGERPDRHHRDVPPHHLRAGRGGHRPAARPHRRAAAPERADGQPDGGPDGARRAAHRRRATGTWSSPTRATAWRSA